MRSHRKRRAAIALLSAVTILLLLSFPLHARAQFIVQTIVAPNVSTLTFADVDIQDATTSKWLFTVIVQPGSEPMGTQAIMEATVSAFLADGESYPDAIDFTTKPFSVPKTFSNVDLSNKSGVRIDKWSFNEAAKNRFKDLALASGAMPAGRYTFDVTVTPYQASGGSTTKEFTIVLTNPSMVELIFPLDGDPSVSPLPLFQWRYDGPTSHISVFEKRPQQATLEEAANGIPQLAMDVSGNSFQYPSSGVRSLEPGKTYVWYVEGLAGVTGGVSQPIRSELRSFVVSAQGTESLQSYLDDLERALDAKYKPVFDQIRSEGLLPTGVIRINGSVISVIELLDIIRELRMNPDAVQNVRIEQ